MRGTLKQVSLIVCLLTVSISIAMIFQNCSNYTPDNSTLQASSLPTPTPACNGYICTENPQGLFLGLGNGIAQINIVEPSPSPSPVPDPPPCTATSTNMTSCFDVAGYCDPGAFPSTQITITLENGSYQTGIDGFPETGTTATCDQNGRFRVLVNLPPNYQYNMQHILIIKMYGLDPINSPNARFDNPNQGNIITIPINAYLAAEFP
jgi:hypothetical protein